MQWQVLCTFYITLFMFLGILFSFKSLQFVICSFGCLVSYGNWNWTVEYNHIGENRASGALYYTITQFGPQPLQNKTHLPGQRPQNTIHTFHHYPKPYIQRANYPKTQTYSPKLHNPHLILQSPSFVQPHHQSTRNKQAPSCNQCSKQDIVHLSQPFDLSIIPYLLSLMPP